MILKRRSSLIAWPFALVATLVTSCTTARNDSDVPGPTQPPSSNSKGVAPCSVDSISLWDPLHHLIDVGSVTATTSDGRLVFAAPAPAGFAAGDRFVLELRSAKNGLVLNEASIGSEAGQPGQYEVELPTAAAEGGIVVRAVWLSPLILDGTTIGETQVSNAVTAFDPRGTRTAAPLPVIDQLLTEGDGVLHVDECTVKDNILRIEGTTSYRPPAWRASVVGSAQVDPPDFPVRRFEYQKELPDGDCSTPIALDTIDSIDNVVKPFAVRLGCRSNTSVLADPSRSSTNTLGTTGLI